MWKLDYAFFAHLNLPIIEILPQRSVEESGQFDLRSWLLNIPDSNPVITSYFKLF